MGRSVRESSAERKRRLQEHHGIAEKLLLANVWWPAIGNLDGLHPEHEVRDFKDGARFVDFGYLPTPQLKVVLELDGYGPHWRDVSRWQFADHLMRQNHLLIDDWRLLRFAYDDVHEKPRRCQQVLLQALGKWGHTQKRADVQLTLYEQVILKFAQGCPDALTPAKVSQALGMDPQTAIKYLRSLAAKGLVTPLQSRTGRIMRYSVAASAWTLFSNK
ncbi:DNA-binding response regulator [Paenibacillus cremeus]|uniref:DNA-binding response regulator n=2 Tax=Paenibacillus cremeus TaxID=2163881 RepID=A0A559K8X8_9BACL|nr:DNA-binding response regulator [Paenibacillus cremeus]